MTDRQLLWHAATAMVQFAATNRCASTAGMALGLHTAAALLSRNVYAQEAAATILTAWASGKPFVNNAQKDMDSLYDALTCDEGDDV